MRHSAVNSSEVARVGGFRIDADYWDPVYIENSKLVSSGYRLKDFVSPHIANIKTSPVNRDFEYLEISRISMTNVEYRTATVAQGAAPDRARHILQKGDVVVSTVRPNRNAVALIEEDGVVGSSGLSVLRPSATVLRGKIESEYLFAFCKTRYFVNCLMRANKASMYPAVSNADVLNTPFYSASESFRNQVARIVRRSISCLSEAKTQRAEAEAILLSEVGLADWRPEQELAFVKNYSDAWHVERIDADYFQPKYDEIVDAIKAYPDGWDTLGNLCSTKRGSLIKDSFYDKKEGTPYIRGGNFSGGVLSYKNMVYINSEFKHSKETQVYENDIVFSLIGSVGESALVTKEFHGAYISNNTGKIECKSLIFATFLQILLASIVGKSYFEKYKTQTAQPKISDKDLHNFVIPILSTDKQRQIERKVAEVSESLNLRQRSKELLECAKRAVEIAIEQDEQTAIDWLRQKTEGGA